MVSIIRTLYLSLSLPSFPILANLHHGGNKRVAPEEGLRTRKVSIHEVRNKLLFQKLTSIRSYAIHCKEIRGRT